MDAIEFYQRFGESADYWGEDRDLSVDDWQEEVANGETRLGYWDWVVNQNNTAPTVQAICQDVETNRTGIDNVDVAMEENLDVMVYAARDQFAEKWGYSLDRIRCLGIVGGDVYSIHWSELPVDEKNYW